MREPMPADDAEAQWRRFALVRSVRRHALAADHLAAGDRREAVREGVLDGFGPGRRTDVRTLLPACRSAHAKDDRGVLFERDLLVLDQLFHVRQRTRAFGIERGGARRFVGIDTGARPL